MVDSAIPYGHWHKHMPENKMATGEGAAPTNADKNKKSKGKNKKNMSKKGNANNSEEDPKQASLKAVP